MFKKIQVVLALVVFSCMPMQVCASRNVKRCVKQARMQQQKWQERVSERSLLMPKPCESHTVTHYEKTMNSPLGLVFMTTLALSALSRCASCNKEKPEAGSNMHWDKIVDVFLPGGFAQGAAAYEYAIKGCKEGLEAVVSCFKNCSVCKDLDINILKNYTITNSSEYDNSHEFFRLVPNNYSSNSISYDSCLSTLEEQCQHGLRQLYEMCQNALTQEINASAQETDESSWVSQLIIVGRVVLPSVIIWHLLKKCCCCCSPTNNQVNQDQGIQTSPYQSRETTPVCNPQRFCFKKS